MNKHITTYNDSNISKIFTGCKLVLSLTLGLVMTIAMTGMVSFSAECNQVRGEVLRLHILANSDSVEDQELKLKVRDRVLIEARTIFAEDESNTVETKTETDKTNVTSNKSDSLKKAEQLAAANLSKLTAVAQNEIYKNGYDYPVSAELTKMYFETREYEGFTMPAGEYDAVRFVIGKGEGKNWWCVMFPPMCIPVSLEEQPDLRAFSGKQLELIQRKPQYEPRFAVVELIESIRNR